MTGPLRNVVLFGLVAILLLGTGLLQSWNLALLIFNMGLVSAIMALGLNLQWGFAGLFNVGIMGFAALGGLATVLVAMPPVPEAWSAGGLRICLALLIGAGTLLAAILSYRQLPTGRFRLATLLVIMIGG